MSRSSRFVFSLLLLPVLIAGAEAALSRESPFTPKGGAPVAAQAAEQAPIEFRGIVSSPSGLKFGIFDPAKQQGAWVGVNESGQVFVVRSYDAAKPAVTVEFQGKVRTLALKEPEYVAASPVPLPPQIQMPVNGAGAPKPAMANVAPASQADENKRLEVVANEVRRRRAMRQAAQTAAPAPAPQAPR